MVKVIASYKKFFVATQGAPNKRYNVTGLGKGGLGSGGLGSGGLGLGEIVGTDMVHS